MHGTESQAKSTTHFALGHTSTACDSCNGLSAAPRDRAITHAVQCHCPSHQQRSVAAPSAAILDRGGWLQHRHLALQCGRQTDVGRAGLNGERAQVLWQPQGLQKLRLLQ